MRCSGCQWSLMLSTRPWRLTDSIFVGLCWFGLVVEETYCLVVGSVNISFEEEMSSMHAFLYQSPTPGPPVRMSSHRARLIVAGSMQLFARQ